MINVLFLKKYVTIFVDPRFLTLRMLIGVVAIQFEEIANPYSK